MAKRILNMTPKELINLSKEEIIDAIAGSEGRVLASETIGITIPLLSDVTNAEFAASMGADMILLNMFDVQDPVILGLPQSDRQETVRKVKQLTGRMVGINLEPVDDAAASENAETLWAMSAGRYATVENAALAQKMGVDMIVLTGNPGNGVSNDAIVSSLRAISAEIGDKIVLAAGKMHASGVIGEGGENIITKEDIRLFVEAGADVILMPAPGTVPGITTEYIRELVSYAHSLGKLTITAIGTSQEGADTDTIKRIALECKMTGTDIHHIGDSGYVGMALPENIMAYSVAIRGIRHTYHRMAQSVER
ncbi:haloacid dehalogenase-like hydrolase [Hominisplanchenecus murintestinalis]|uniref:Haloacid dehalogenase-like hydrolase n=1 Tax=Hominisplanchenecus murintestinalis TaxID=2941517 RepID=A0AC61QZJ6_9FIRM|nr:haloacid dehalogenase-like hydrolase [Hominisplanchenecus murintestinalis]TGX98735.1 haloacid dehalogenase-like hydrolase [Hominisplanchenecus murintestinalis]